MEENRGRHASSHVAQLHKTRQFELSQARDRDVPNVLVLSFWIFFVVRWAQPPDDTDGGRHVRSLVDNIGLTYPTALPPPTTSYHLIHHNHNHHLPEPNHHDSPLIKELWVEGAKGMGANMG